MELATIHEFKLSTDTEKRFNQLEKIIEKGMTHFVEVGTALSLIREEKLYKLLFSTFEEYCQERWGFNSSRARQLIGAARINENIKSVTIVTPPKTESQIRPLTKLEPEQQPKAWKKATETAPKGKITAKHVQTIVDEMEGINEQTRQIIEADQAEEVEDTPILKQLKKYWNMADKFEKQTFITWVKEERYA
jgi:hypothetical protein